MKQSEEAPAQASSPLKVAAPPGVLLVPGRRLWERNRVFVTVS